MNLVADESVDQRIIEGLRLAGHKIVSVAEEAGGSADDQVLALAETHGTVLLTADKDFGELVYRQQLAHRGVILLRQAGLSIEARVEAVRAILEAHADEVAGSLTVISPASARIRRSGRAGE